MDVAHAFLRHEKMVGIQDLNDIISECYMAFWEAWEKVDWIMVYAAKKPQAALWSYLKKNIQLNARHRINTHARAIKIPRYKRWEIRNTKRLDEFLWQLFPSGHFEENAEEFGVAEDIVPYDIEQLGFALDDVLSRHLSSYERSIVELSFGIECDKHSMKKIAAIHKRSVSAITSAKNTAMQKLKNEDVIKELEDFF